MGERIDLDGEPIGYEAASMDFALRRSLERTQAEGKIPTPHTDALTRRVVERVRGAFTVKQARAIRRELDWPVDANDPNLSDLDSALAAIDRFLGAVDSDELADAAEVFGISEDQRQRDEDNERQEALRALNNAELTYADAVELAERGVLLVGQDIPDERGLCLNDRCPFDGDAYPFRR